MRVTNAFLSHKPQDARQGFLPDIFDRRSRPQASACLQPNQFAEVSHKMLLGPEIAGTKPIQIRTVEILKLQSHSFSSLGGGGLAHSVRWLRLLGKPDLYAENGPPAIT